MNIETGMYLINISLFSVLGFCKGLEENKSDEKTFNISPISNGDPRN